MLGSGVPTQGSSVACEPSVGCSDPFLGRFPRLSRISSWPQTPRRLSFTESRSSQLVTMSEWTKKSPLEWEDYVYKEVRVLASEKKEYKGWLLTTDPVSANIVLVSFLEDGRLSVTGIMGHSVQTVETVGEADPRVREKLMHLFTSGDCKGYSPEDLEKRKNSLKKWLEKNHIPVSEQGDAQRTLCVAGVLTIDPPYAPENCSSSNEIILSRIQDLIQGHLSASQ